MIETPRENLEQDMLVFANKHGVSRFKISTYNFDLEYERGQDNAFYLKTQKAIVRALGRVTKVPIGEDETYKTFEDAQKATKKYWQEYYRNVRQNRSEKERIAEAKRQKRYREKKRAEKQEFKERQ